MTTYDNTQIAQGRAGLFTSFAQTFARMMNRIAIQRTRDELHRLSDRELDDIGLSRSDIDRVLRDMRY